MKRLFIVTVISLWVIALYSISGCVISVNKKLPDTPGVLFVSGSGDTNRFIEGGYQKLPTKSEIHKAMELYRKDNPNCELCGARSGMFGMYCEVHHYNPQHLFPKDSANTNNMVTLCKKDHWWVGHCNKNFKCYNANLRETIKMIRMAYSNTVIMKTD